MIPVSLSLMERKGAAMSRAVLLYPLLAAWIVYAQGELRPSSALRLTMSTTSNTTRQEPGCSIMASQKDECKDCRAHAVEAL